MKITGRHFKIFRRECRRWLRFFGLTDWQVYYEHREADTDDRAWCETKLSARTATIGLNAVWDCEPDDYGIDANEEMRKAAFHEVVELLLSPLYSEALYRFTTGDALVEADHGIVRRLENAVYTRKEVLL